MPSGVSHVCCIQKLLKCPHYLPIYHCVHSYIVITIQYEQKEESCLCYHGYYLMWRCRRWNFIQGDTIKQANFCRCVFVLRGGLFHASLISRVKDENLKCVFFYSLHSFRSSNRVRGNCVGCKKTQIWDSHPRLLKRVMQEGVFRVPPPAIPGQVVFVRKSITKIALKWQCASHCTFKLNT